MLTAPRFSLPAAWTPRSLLRLTPLLGVFLLAAAAHAGDQCVRCPLADGFDYPVGRPEAKGYYKARGFIPKAHLGEDWDGVGGGDTDLGDPVYAVATGVVVLSANVHMGWGNVIMVRHAYRESDGHIALIDSLYGHVLERKVKLGDIVTRGQLIASIGTGDGLYPAHLHLEIRKNIYIGMFRTLYAQDYSNYYSPTAFINGHRTCASDRYSYEVPIDTFTAEGRKLAQPSVNGASSVAVRPSETPARRGAEPPPGSSNRGNVVVESNGRQRLTLPVGDEPARSHSGTSGLTNSAGRPIAPPLPEESKADFWSRLRNKLANGQVTDGVNR